MPWPPFSKIHVLFYYMIILILISFLLIITWTHSNVFHDYHQYNIHESFLTILSRMLSTYVCHKFSNYFCFSLIVNIGQVKSMVGKNYGGWGEYKRKWLAKMWLLRLTVPWSQLDLELRTPLLLQLLSGWPGWKTLWSKSWQKKPVNFLRKWPIEWPLQPSNKPSENGLRCSVPKKWSSFMMWPIL